MCHGVLGIGVMYKHNNYDVSAFFPGYQRNILTISKMEQIRFDMIHTLQ